MIEEYVQLLNESNETIGTMEKMKAHREGRLHRAVSVFVFHSDGTMLLQQRAAGKYHSPGLWSNACCTHPRLDEAPLSAAQRRLKEELGLECHLEHKSDFLYRAELDNGLIEHEFDHIFIGYCDDAPIPNSNEVDEYMYLPVDEIYSRMKTQPDQFTVWFRLLFNQLFAVS